MASTVWESVRAAYRSSAGGGGGAVYCREASEDAGLAQVSWWWRGREGRGGGDNEVEMSQVGAGERTKNVLILMSDTGGGHRASAEAIRDAFHLQFGDEYRVFVKDLCKEHAGWPLNRMEKSYKFMLKHVQLWKVAFHGTSPRWVHSAYLTAIAAFYAKYVSQFSNYFINIKFCRAIVLKNFSINLFLYLERLASA